LTYSHLGQSPNFEALSYTWGKARPPPATEQNIVLNSQIFPVFENLFAALQRLRHLSKARVLWIDAICINQKDIQERQEQVLLMRQIYEQAQQVVV
jgi:hypothetical protein